MILLQHHSLSARTDRLPSTRVAFTATPIDGATVTTTLPLERAAALSTPPILTAEVDLRVGFSAEPAATPPNGSQPRLGLSDDVACFAVCLAWLLDRARPRSPATWRRQDVLRAA
ncbi:hypothetical protein PaG_02636 [Moesziomyces aphidis]|uniref:Uncharacterized protein n=1 Tax=Moesziomyces aphidis TaxID=84754 RepID=W3VQ25_MOEAP|nr:hypothetical protein PaG_02636 [Moesziomyces aphidis]